MKYIILTIALLTMSCGIKVEHDVKGHVDPIEIKHYVVLDTTKLEDFYRVDCEKQFTIQADIDKCVSDQLAAFMKSFTFES